MTYLKQFTNEDLVDGLLDASYYFEGSHLQRDRDLYLTYKNELLSRLAAGREAVEKVTSLTADNAMLLASADADTMTITNLNNEINRFAKILDDLKCCENCAHIADSYPCYRDTHNTTEGFCCQQDWKYDNLTREERSKL